MASFPTGLASSLDGINQSRTQFNNADQRIATQGPSPTDSVDLISARIGNSANVQAARVEDDMTKSTLDLLA